MLVGEGPAPRFVPAPGAPAAGADRFIDRPIPLLQRENEVQRVLFARPEAAVAGVLNAVTPNQYFSKKVLRLERYDLTRGQPLGGLNLCIDPQYRSGESVPSDSFNRSTSECNCFASSLRSLLPSRNCAKRTDA